MKFKIKSSKGFYNLELSNSNKIIFPKYIKTINSIIIIDSQVLKKNKKLKKIIKNYKTIKINSSEKIKEYSKLKNIIEFIINNQFKRDHYLIAIGGGVIQDITSFVASILFRGVKWIFYPTTLESQGDSCIGSKTSINFNNKKKPNWYFLSSNKYIFGKFFFKISFT